MTLVVVILANPSGDLEVLPASSAYNIPHTVLRAFFSRLFESFAATIGVPSRNTVSETMTGSAAKRCTITSTQAGPETLNNGGDETRPNLSPWQV